MSADHPDQKPVHRKPFLFARAWSRELASIEPSFVQPAAPANIDWTNPDDDKTHLEKLRKAVDAKPEPLAAFCLSGGGIRSAAFGLGVIQGLASFGLLSQFHYLSTVSGGGYIGSWLSAWRYHAKDNDEKVEADLNRLFNQGEEAKEIEGLRDNSAYLTPHRGILSADLWATIVIVVRNLILNWCVFAPFFLGVFCVPKILDEMLQKSNSFVTTPLRLDIALLALFFAVWMSHYGRLKSTGKWLTDKRFLLLVVAPLIVSATFFTGAAAAGNAPEFSLIDAALAGAALFAAASLSAKMAIGRVVRPPPIWGELAAWAIGGALTGALIGLGLNESAAVAAHLPPDALLITGPFWFVFALMTGELVFIGLSSFTARGETNREWLARSSGWIVAVTITWSVIAITSLYGPGALSDAWGKYIVPTGGSMAGLITLYIGANASTAATLVRSASSRLSTEQVVQVSAVIFSLFLMAVLSAGDEVILDLLPRTALPSTFIAIVLIAGSLGVSYFININRFSLHALYRNRLVREFLGAGRASVAKRADTDPFTRFAVDDNIALAKMAAHPAGKPKRLLQVVNVALNISMTDKLAWQERKAESFTLTPLACGNPLVGYRDTHDYGDPRGGISLGTAMAISGAAVSPNMGYHSSPLVGFLMMLFNVRLGWWLGNPAKNRYRRSGPAPGLFPALAELASATTDKNDWVYLSDGGHFDDLGVYEMVRRRCRVIVVSDAGADLPCAFEDFSNSLRKSFLDMGVSVSFKKLVLATRLSEPQEMPYCAVGEINYPGSTEPGWLLYIKPGYHGTEPIDVRGFALSDATFPHDSTLNQFYSEAQFESYRALGAHIVGLMGRGGRQAKPGDPAIRLSFDDFKQSVEAYLAPFDKA